MNLSRVPRKKYTVGPAPIEKPPLFAEAL